LSYDINAGLHRLKCDKLTSREAETKRKIPVIYQTKSGAIELRGDLEKETVWASQARIVDLFGVDQSVVSRHIRNVFKDG